MKKQIKKLLPNSLVLFLKNRLKKLELQKAYRYDLNKYLQHSSVVTYADSEEKLIANIIRNYHVIEKGLTMPVSRPGFGKDRMIGLIKDCLLYLSNYGSKDIQLEHAIQVVMEYKKLHASLNYVLATDLEKKINELVKQASSLQPHEQKEINVNEYFKYINAPFPTFSASRSSIRNYATDNVPEQVMIAAMELAKNTPSACNRQTVRSYLYTDTQKIAHILELQGGNRGFGHLANKLIVLTAELGVFISTAERNQAFVDGGMHAMNLLYALHHHTVAACILNCSHDPEKDKRLRKACGIKDSEVFIAMIACGYPPENFRVASSKRHPSGRNIRINH